MLRIHRSSCLRTSQLMAVAALVLDEEVGDTSMVPVITVAGTEDVATPGHEISANSVASLATLCNTAGSVLTGTSPATRRWQTWWPCRMVSIPTGIWTPAL
jgi:hypothetical protein